MAKKSPLSPDEKAKRKIELEKKRERGAFNAPGASVRTEKNGAFCSVILEEGSDCIYIRMRHRERLTTSVGGLEEIVIYMGDDARILLDFTLAFGRRLAATLSQQNENIKQINSLGLNENLTNSGLLKNPEC